MSGIGNTLPGLTTEEERKPKNVSCSKIQIKSAFWRPFTFGAGQRHLFLNGPHDSPRWSYLYAITVQPTMLNPVPSDACAKRVGVPPLNKPKKSVAVPGLPDF